MPSPDVEDKVAAHYGASNLTKRVLEALGLENAQPGSVAVETLFPVDQLHHGGVGLTEAMATAANIPTGAKVLDAGSGLGGSGRFLVDRLNCVVQAIDLSEDFVETARDLDVLVGFSDYIEHQAGSVTSMPYDASTFDVVWSQNVTMNVPDKAAMFAEAFRVLRPGGVYVISHIGETGVGVIDYPLPWAMTSETSFAISPLDMVDALKAAGFQDVTDHAADAPPPAPPPPGAEEPADSVAMGDDMPLRRANTMRAVGDGRLARALITARR